MDEKFKQEVLTLRLKHLQAATERDLKIDDLEDTVLARLKENLPFMVKTNDLLRAFAVINAAKRRGARSTGAVDQGGKVVAIVLPVAAKTAFITNGKGEVVQVGETVTVTKPLQQLLAERRKNASDAAIINDEPKTLAGPIGSKEGATKAAA